MKRAVFGVILMLLLFLPDMKLYACTIFTAQDDNSVLAGNNEDFFFQYQSNMWFTAAGDKSNGRVCFANSSFVQGGMNDRGLFYDGASCPDTEVQRSADKDTLGMDLGEIILSRCATVDEAVALLGEYNIPEYFTDHLLFADASGKALVVEWVGSEMKVIRKKENFQIATNFYLSEPGLGGYPCPRYAAAEKMLTGTGDISVCAFVDILKATAQKWDGGGTKYSNVYDLKKRTFYVYSRGNFDQYAFFSLDDELKKLKPEERVDYNIDRLSFTSAGTGSTAAIEADPAVSESYTASRNLAVSPSIDMADTSATVVSNTVPTAKGNPGTSGQSHLRYFVVLAAGIACMAFTAYHIKRHK